MSFSISVWWPRWTPIITSFAVVLTAYWLYALAVVPWIEPEIAISPPDDSQELFPEPVQERQLLEALFSPGAWELDQPKVIESRQTKLLFRDYTKQTPNTVELRPCTLIFIPEDSDLDWSDRYRRAVVMEVPEGAVLEFDQPLDLTQGKMGRLVRGQLQGPVRIRSEGPSPGAEDNLRISTRQVTLTQKEITTPEKVEFSWGPHFGRGENLRIELSPEGGTSSGLSLGGFRSLEVRRVEVVHLEVPEHSNRLLPGQAPRPAGRSSEIRTEKVTERQVSQNVSGPSLLGKEGEIASAEAWRRPTPSSEASDPAWPTSPVERRIEGQGSAANFVAKKALDSSESTSPKSNPGVAEITCQGPFRFDAQKLEASFTEKVQVRYLPPEGPTDFLYCDRLVVGFRSSSGLVKKSGASASAKQTSKESVTPTASSPPSAKKTSPRLEPQRLEAVGRPVRLEAPSRQSRAMANRLEYHLLTGRTVLEGGEEVWICHGPHEIHAHKLEYTPGPGGQLGQGAAEGPGWLQAQADPRTGQTVQAKWAQSLQLRPYQGQQVLSLLGEAEVLFSGIGRLAAQQIHLWINQQSPSGPPSAREVISPDRLLAEGKVHLQHPQVSAWVDRLEVWFETAGWASVPPPVSPPIGASDPNRQDRFGKKYPSERLLPLPGLLRGSSSEGPWWQVLVERSGASVPLGLIGLRSGIPTGWSEDLAQPAGSNPLVAPAPVAPIGPQTPTTAPQTSMPQHFEVRSTLLRALIRLAGQHTELMELILEGNVFLSETQTAQPGQKPLVVTGDQIHVVDASRPYLAMSVQGQPAHVEARGLGLNGPKINLHRGNNRLWIDGPGWMSLPADRPGQEPSSGQGEPIDIHWQHRMEFDGRSIRFEDSVLASSSRWQLRTDSLEVQLREPIVFTAPQTPRNPQLHRLICRSEVLLENRSWDAQGELSRDQVHVADLTVDLTTGDLTATGPGSFSSVRRVHRGSLPAAEKPASKGESGEGLVQNPRLSNLRPDSSPTGLVFLAVEFQRSLVGNLQRREMTFTDQVRTIYGPVQSWEEKITWSQQAHLPQQVVFLSSDQLSVAELVLPSAGDRFMELWAVGNTVIESAGYMARAQRLSYAENKGLVILEGDGRTDAELFSQERIGGPRQRVAARKIYYWPATNHLTLDNASLLEVHQPEKKR